MTPPLLIGNILVGDTLIGTPVGNLDRARTEWRLDVLPATTYCPAWAILFAIFLAPCTGLLSLLFLLVKAPSKVVVAQVTVFDGYTQHTVAIPSPDYARHLDVRAVNWARRPPAAPHPALTTAMEHRFAIGS